MHNLTNHLQESTEQEVPKYDKYIHRNEDQFMKNWEHGNFIINHS